MTKVDEKIEILYKLYTESLNSTLPFIVLQLNIRNRTNLKITNYFLLLKRYLLKDHAINPGKIILNNKIKYKK